MTSIALSVMLLLLLKVNGKEFSSTSSNSAMIWQHSRSLIYNHKTPPPF